MGFFDSLFGSPNRRRKAKRRRNPSGGTFLDSAEDMRWLKSVHKISAKSAILYGNEDAPTKVEAFRKRSPSVNDTPVVYEQNDAGDLVRRNPGGSDNMNADELTMFIVNDADLYRQNIQPVLKNLAKKIKKGVYDPAKALKLWQYSAQWGAQKYTKEFRISGTHGSYGMFSPHDRREAAKQLAEHYEEELREVAGTKSNPRRATMARRRKIRRVKSRGRRVVFGKGRNRRVVIFRHKTSKRTSAKKRAAGRRLARMWTRAERMANLRKAWRKRLGYVPKSLRKRSRR